jgi:hypothetical protein
VPLHFEPGELVVPGKDGLPGGVAKRRGSLRGFDDVSEQHGGEHPVRETAEPRSSLTNVST